MNASFGIDHPLIAVHDINVVRNRLSELGFTMTPVGKHPWGTSTSLAMFNGCLIEIMGVYDESLIDEKPAGDFHFGRHVFEHLSVREGVALTALHSTASEQDANTAANAGFTVAGHLEFGRDVTLPNGSEDRTKTTLALLPDATWPRLSLFLCQQHRPELVYVSEWLTHPNSVNDIAGITVVAGEHEIEAVSDKLASLYGIGSGGIQSQSQSESESESESESQSKPQPEIDPQNACQTRFQTANGCITLLTPSAARLKYGHLPLPVENDDTPSIIGMTLAYQDENQLNTYLKASGVSFQPFEHGFLLTEAEKFGNVFFDFQPAEPHLPQ